MKKYIVLSSSAGRNRRENYFGKTFQTRKEAEKSIKKISPAIKNMHKKMGERLEIKEVYKSKTRRQMLKPSGFVYPKLKGFKIPSQFRF
jgi:hypothetical protein